MLIIKHKRKYRKTITKIMSVDPKEESKFKELTQGYSPDNYSVLKIRSHESRLRWLVYSILGFLALVIAIILYLQTLCLDI